MPIQRVKGHYRNKRGKRSYVKAHTRITRGRNAPSPRQVIEKMQRIEEEKKIIYGNPELKKKYTDKQLLLSWTLGDITQEDLDKVYKEM